ncbi:MAG: hypothetical protein U0350_02465 [Caldilineaceae bacterium]
MHKIAEKVYELPSGEIIVEIAENLYVDASGRLIIDLDATLLSFDNEWMIERVEMPAKRMVEYA